MLIEPVKELAGTVGISQACNALDLPRSTLYYNLRDKRPPLPRPSPARKLSDEERQRVLDILHSERFVDKSPGEIYATLLDEGQYHCSERTMYRILASEKEIRERRRQARHPQYSKPELLATGPNQVWSWDITRLKGPQKWSYYYLYVIIDIFSRYVVGWMVAPRESAALAKRLIDVTCKRQHIEPGKLIIHSDRGSPMIAKTTTQLLITLGVNPSYSRPHVSDDNPYSESHFKTLKYRPEFPDRFGSIQDAVAFCNKFFTWYNYDHRHSGIAMLTPATIHYGVADMVNKSRQVVLAAAYERHPERFVKGKPKPRQIPTEAWINPPRETKGGDGAVL